MIEPIEAKSETDSGILLPEAAKEKPQTGRVIATGPGVYQDGARVPMTVVVGDTVLYSKYTGTEFGQLGKKYLIVRESDIMAILE